jgi:hypothetical protein
MKEFVDGNFECEFYTLLDLTIAKNAIIGLLAGIEPAELLTESSCRALTASSCINIKVMPMPRPRGRIRPARPNSELNY